MRKYLLFLFILLGLVFNQALAKNNRIELTDGSVVNGKIISYTNGTYAIDSEGMGTLLINESKIKNIGFDDSTENQPIAGAADDIQLPAGQAETLKNQIMSDPKAMESIAALKDDPQVQEVFNDPEIIAAIKAGDINALSKNEKFMSLTKNPKIQELKDSVSK